MWAMLAAPLIAGNDLRTMSPETTRILTNKEVIAVDQDSLGIQGFKHRVEGEVEVWFKPLRDGDWAMAVLNRGETAARFEIDWRRQVVADELSGREARFGARRFQIRDLWTGQDLGTTHRALTAEVPGHDVLMVRLRRLAGELGQ